MRFVEVDGHLHVPAALPPGESVSGTHWAGGWMGPRAGLDAVAKRFSPLLMGIEPRLSGPLCSHCTD
jgi:hypothetical protein